MRELRGQARSKGSVREEKAFPVSSLTVPCSSSIEYGRQGARLPGLCFEKMVGRSYQDLTLLPLCSLTLPPHLAHAEYWAVQGRMALRVVGALLFWRYVRTPEQPGKGKGCGGSLRFQLSCIGASWDKAKVLSEPEGFLVLLHFKGLLQ